jgi:hypothetical protein
MSTCPSSATRVGTDHSEIDQGKQAVHGRWKKTGDEASCGSCDESCVGHVYPGRKHVVRRFASVEGNTAYQHAATYGTRWLCPYQRPVLHQLNSDTARREAFPCGQWLASTIVIGAWSSVAGRVGAWARQARFLSTSPVLGAAQANSYAWAHPLGR